MRSGTPEDYRQLCMREDEELLQLCLEMDAHLEAAQRTLAGFNGFNTEFFPKYPTLARPNQMCQQFFEPHMAMGLHPFPLQLPYGPLPAHPMAFEHHIDRTIRQTDRYE